MMSLFASFDMKLWFLGLLPFLLFNSMILYKFWVNNLVFSFSGLVKKELEMFFFSLTLQKMVKLMLILIISILTMVFYYNFSSIFPYNFAYTSQISMVFSFALTLWLMVILFSLSKNLKGFISHSIPEGCPMYLIVVLYMIEIISNFIRPITLTVRLVANILAGHLLMSLLAKLIFIYPTAFPFLIGLSIVEVFVSMIQSYIFCTMVILYFSELF